MTDESGANTKAEAAKAAKGKIRVKLFRKAISAHDQTDIREIEFREPSVADILAVGVPCSWAWEVGSGTPAPRVSIDAPRMNDMMVRLAAVPPSSIRMMHPVDWANCANQL